ncbi:hypothetical protein J27TS8_16680 [Robertmurraya siralis]|uniref:Uncharacterized protein n=1 Tax=Robertmurraya siralis TaxID=77777 RepID=A0A919WGU9_9BACI|nr:helix-turn-helix domain-containing protein [Robertmurraya siralis]PAE21513.1 DNA-binding response regulator [Bacillus sp. 7504-2]GIN61675.1 hypothetical protein J27TS8_16680 [Robertmurraya siralis]
MYNILLVDDEIIAIEALKVIFAQIENTRVIGAANSAESAKELFENSQLHMTFLDIKIPGADIIYLIKYMKRRNPKNRIILLTDYGSYDFVFKALEMGADSYLLKPYRQTDILRLVNMYLSQEHAQSINLEQTMERLLGYVSNEDYNNSIKMAEILTEQLFSEYDKEHDKIHLTTQSLIKMLDLICRQKGIFLSHKLEWTAYHEVDTRDFHKKLKILIDSIFDTIRDSKSDQEIKVIQAVLKYIEKNYQKGVTLEAAAEHVHLSPYYLSKLFKKELKINFVNYVTKRKMEKAKELLESTDLPVINIAMELNFQEPNYFSKVFKKVVGLTPSEYRKRAAEISSQSDMLKRHTSILNGKWFI